MIILITGASSGIGKALSEFFSVRNHTIIGCSRNIETDIKFDEAYKCDITDEYSVKRMFMGIRKEFGHIDVLINCAGIASMNHIATTPIDTFRRIMETNFIGTVIMTREAVKNMLESGRIINFSTVAVDLNLEGEAAYVASKAAVEAFTKVAAKEFAHRDITVNAISPGPVIGSGLIKNLSADKIEKIISHQAIKDSTVYAEIADVVSFFMKDSSSAITGQIIKLGGP